MSHMLERRRYRIGILGELILISSWVDRFHITLFWISLFQFIFLCRLGFVFFYFLVGDGRRAARLSD